MSDFRLFGREKITTYLDYLDSKNICDELKSVLQIHCRNIQQENELYWRRRGKQPILNRVKEIRPEICNKVVMNFAEQTVSFRNGYFLTKPVFYVSRNNADPEKVRKLNDFLFRSGKHKADNKVVDWFHTVGIGVMYITPGENKEEPFKAYALDPRNAFVVYSLKPGNVPMYAVHIVATSKNEATATVFTRDEIFTLKGSFNQGDFSFSGFKLINEEVNMYGLIPIIEYQANENRMACFEASIPLQDEYNTIESNRADGIEQTIQSLLLAINVSFEEGTTSNDVRDRGIVCIQSDGENPASLELIESKLNQTETQTTLDSLKSQILSLNGVPNSVMGSSFENVGAAYMDRGYAITDTLNRNTEDCWRESDARATEVILRIINKMGVKLGITQNDIDIHFSKPEIDNLLVRTQGALNLKTLGFSPEITFAKSGLSNDPISDVIDSKEYIDKMWNTSEEAEANKTNIEDSTNG